MTGYANPQVVLANTLSSDNVLNVGYAYLYNAATPNLVFKWSRGNGENNSTIAIDSNWNYLCVTNDGSDVTNFYTACAGNSYTLAGIGPYSPTTGIPDVTGFDFRIGYGYNVAFYNGAVTEFMLYTKALSMAEANQNFLAQRALFGV